MLENDYVSEEEYQVFGFGQPPDNFSELVMLASDVVDYLTRYYYVFNEINEDKIPFRKKQFKKAICAQIKYYDDMGATSTGALNNTPNEIVIGRTSIAMNGRKGSNTSSTVQEISNDTIRYLVGTGLLYRGV